LEQSSLIFWKDTILSTNCILLVYLRIAEQIARTKFLHPALHHFHSLSILWRRFSFTPSVPDGGMPGRPRKVNYFGPVLENWLGEGPYFLGDQVSAVDFLAAKPLNNANSMGLLKDFPSLQALFEDMRSRPSFTSAYVIMPSNSVNNNDIDVKRSMILVPGNW
jgi:glutathione S-transferase